jgi:hypothetical protein
MNAETDTTRYENEDGSPLATEELTTAELAERRAIQIILPRHLVAEDRPQRVRYVWPSRFEGPRFLDKLLGLLPFLPGLVILGYLLYLGYTWWLIGLKETLATGNVYDLLVFLPMAAVLGFLWLIVAILPAMILCLILMRIKETLFEKWTEITLAAGNLCVVHHGFLQDDGVMIPASRVERLEVLEADSGRHVVRVAWDGRHANLVQNAHQLSVVPTLTVEPCSAQVRLVRDVP